MTKVSYVAVWNCLCTSTTSKTFSSHFADIFKISTIQVESRGNGPICQTINVEPSGTLFENSEPGNFSLYFASERHH